MNKLRSGSIYVQAVENLCGGAHFTLQGDDAYENIISWTGNQTKIPTKEEVDEEVARLNTLIYQLKRSGEYTFDPDYNPNDGTYPDLGEQLDLLYHDIEAGTLTTSGNFYKTLKAVKDKFPKPS
tara:strand:+ start:1721 stop:2092 length:372 start_codon:yes stop_codon:yes gene_type:complete